MILNNNPSACNISFELYTFAITFFSLSFSFFLSSQADNISEGQRASAFGVLSGVASAAFVCGTLAARFLSTASTFQVLVLIQSRSSLVSFLVSELVCHVPTVFLSQVATLVSMIATVYMRVFLKETFPKGDSSQALLKKEPGMSPDDGNSSEKIQTFKKIPSVGDLISLLKCRYLRLFPSHFLHEILGFSWSLAFQIQVHLVLRDEWSQVISLSFLVLYMFWHTRYFAKPFVTGRHFHRLQSSSSSTVLQRVASRPHCWYSSSSIVW